MPIAFYSHIKCKNRTMYMAEPQNLDSFKPFFTLESKKTNKNKEQGQFFMLFVIIFQAKKLKMDLWITRAKKGLNPKMVQSLILSTVPCHKNQTIFTAEPQKNCKTHFLPCSLKDRSRRLRPKVHILDDPSGNPYDSLIVLPLWSILWSLQYLE